MSFTKRQREIVRDFCLGKAPSRIDRERKLAEGTSHDVIIDWWYEDKVYRNGGMGSVFDGWKLTDDYRMMR